MTEQDWRDSLKVGDEVAVRENGRFSIHKIEGITDSKIITKYHKFSRKTGFSFNNNGCALLCPVTPHLKEGIEDGHERKRLRAIISLALPRASADTLRAMIKALDAVPDEPAEPRESERRFRPGGFVPRAREESEPE